MKKLTSLLLVVLMLIGCVACSDGSKTVKDDTKADTPTYETQDPSTEPETPAIVNKMLPMPQVQIAPENPAKDVTLPSYEVEALIEVARAYLARTAATQYEDGGFTSSGERWFNMFAYAPESGTSQNTYYSSCSPFMKDVVWQAWGVDITEPNIWTAAQMAQADKYSTWNYTVKGNETNAEKEKIKQEFLSHLKPGDFIAVHKSGPQGHIFLYVGDGWVIHSYCNTSVDEGNYDHSKNDAHIEKTGAIVYRGLDTIFKEGNYYEFWKYTKWSIMRPAEYIKDIKLTDQTKLRMENLRDIYVEKISSHPVGLTAQIGEEITYGFYLRNDRQDTATVEIKDILPDNTTYVSGAEKLDGKNLSWSVTLASKEEKLICYTVKVDENPELYNGGIIKSNSATAGGVILPCNDIYITKKLDEVSLKNLQNVCMDLSQSTATGIDLAKEFYQKAGLELNLPDQKGLFASLFSLKNNNYFLNGSSGYYSMIVPHLYGGYRTKGDDAKKGERNKFLDYELMAGDILVCHENSETKVYMYAGDNKIVSLAVSGGKAYVGKNYDKILQSVFGHDVYAVLRPYSK